MPELPEWKYQTIIKPIIEHPQMHIALHGRVITCNGDKVIEDGYVELEAGKIKTVTSDKSKLSDGVKVFETNGSILPGMYNNHAHLGWDGIHDLAAQSIHDNPEIGAYKAAANMLLSLKAGITTVCDLGVNSVNVYAKQAVGQGIFPGPRLRIAGRAIVMTGGHTYWACRQASGADEMRRAVRENIMDGADLIKLMASHDTLEYTDEELRALIDEAHRHHLQVRAHATTDEGIARMALFGADVIEHGGAMTDETIQILLDKKLPIVATYAVMVVQGDPEIAPKYNIQPWRIKARQEQRKDGSRFDGVVRAAKAGVPIAFGTDAGSPAVQHDVVVPELKFGVELGIYKDNYTAIRAATSLSAKINNQLNILGTLEEGKYADVIVTHGNPVANLDDLKRIRLTFVEGRCLYQEGILSEQS